MIAINIDASELDALEKKLRALDGEHQLSTDELITDDFVREHSGFETWGAFQDAAGVKDGEDFETDWFSDFVAQNTEFES